MAAKTKSKAITTKRDDGPTKLDAEQRALLNEALRRSEDLREEVEAKVTAFGRWMLGEVFKDDAAAALDRKTENPVWRELLRRAGGPTLRVGRRMLYVSLQLAARDKRINDQAWRGLDAGRKELLLPLAEDAKLREAAQHVSKFNLTQASTRQYVSELLDAEGKPKLLRLTVPRLVAQVQKLRATLGSASAMRKVEALRASVDPRQRAKAADELDQLREVLAKMAKSLRAKE